MGHCKGLFWDHFLFLFSVGVGVGVVGFGRDLLWDVNEMNGKEKGEEGCNGKWRFIPLIYLCTVTSVPFIHNFLIYN